MARSRRGSFGLQPRVAPNVTGQIVAMAREYVAKRDALIMDAWRQGGTFEGKKATDDMVLAYWNERSKGLDQSDPDYEQAKNQVMQLTYAVEQSKADVKHLQGKMSDNEYAQFFLKWAKKVPANSEFYRTLQKDAAQLIESAKAKSKAAGERAKTEAFNAFVKSTTARDIAIGDAMTRALGDLSKKTGLSVTGNGDELLALLTKDVAANPHDYKMLLDTIHTADPHWNGQLTEGYFNQHITAATKGYELIADRASKAGFVSAYASATQGMSAMAEWGQNLKVWPVAQSYSTIENALLKVWNDPSASQMDKAAAAAKASEAFTKLTQTPGIDVGSRTMIEADAQRLLGQDAGDNPSFGTTALGRPGIDPKMAAQAAYLIQTKQAYDLNPAMYAYAPTKEDGTYDPSGKGAIGIVPAGAVQPGSNGVMIPGTNGVAVMAMIPSHTIYAIDPNNPNAAPIAIGHQMSYNVGGRQINLWGYADAKGVTRWSLDSPTSNDAVTQVDNKGDVYVTPKPVSLDQQIGSLTGAQLSEAQKATLAAGGSIDQIVDTSSKGKAGSKTTVTVSVKNGYITSTTRVDEIDEHGRNIGGSTTPTSLTKMDTMSAFAPSRLAAGDVPGVTFTSPLAASVAASSYTQTQDQTGKFTSDPGFQQAFLSQTMQTLGITNPLDTRINSAWQQMTSTHPANSSGSPDDRMEAAFRKDLSYPGDKPQAQGTGQLNINFGHGELKLPGLPSYLGNQNVNAGALGGIGNVAAAGLGALGSILPGLGIPQTQAGTPTPTIYNQPPAPTKPATVSTTPGVAPTSVTPTPGPGGMPPPPRPTYNDHGK